MLIALLGLGDSDFELGVKLVKIDGKLSCSGRSEVSLGMNGEIRVVTFVGEERRNSGSSVWSIIVSELCQWKQAGPIILLIVAVHLEVLFEGLIDTFCLAVARSEVT